MVVGGCERAGGFNLPYTDCYDPFIGEWKSLAKHPEFTKSEYGVCALRNDILVSGELAVCGCVFIRPSIRLQYYIILSVSMRAIFDVEECQLFSILVSIRSIILLAYSL